jgi:hypothetical protein
MDFIALATMFGLSSGIGLLSSRLLLDAAFQVIARHQIGVNAGRALP